jgi:glycosyltransferase involved in cell wall biosynthesis
VTHRRILLASYHFPPSAAVGGLRIAKFAKVLPELGWEPYVLTVRSSLRADGLDKERLQGLECVPVVETGELPRLLEFAVDRLTVLRQRLRSAAAEDGGRDSGSHGHYYTLRAESLERRLGRYVASLLLQLPDDKKNWAARAIPSAIRLIRRHGISWVFTSGPPFSGHAIGLAAKTLTNARWVADFRDPWVDMLPDRYPETRSRLSDWIERGMEAGVVRRADLVVTTTGPMRDAIHARYPDVPPERIVCIPNGIDARQVERGHQPRAAGPLTIIYAGSLYFDRTPEPLFAALAALRQSGRAQPHDILVRFVGDCECIEGIRTCDLARRYGVQDAVEVLPRVPFSEAIRLMQEAHLLLVLAPTCHRLVVPAKIYDYLGSGSLILALAEPGATTDLIAETRSGACFSDSDVAGVADYLAGALRDRDFRTRKNDPSAFDRYAVHHLTEQLITEMKHVDARSAGPAAVHA